jgi:uncharacterized membrane protein YphA (DoxX/SURF4 family)
VKPWLVYTGMRIGIFAIALVVLLLIGVTPWLAAIVAAVIGLCVAYIFFRPQRDRLAESVDRRANSVSQTKRVSRQDEDAEDF